MSLSICMIARNEEKTIGRALRSVQDVADEIVVVDTGSTDDTREIAAGLGARVCDFHWRDHFADARNFALEMADGTTWQAWLDADDELAVDSVKRLAEIKNDPADCIIGWKLNNIGVLHSSMWDVGVIEAFQQRMFPRGVKFRGAVHETITSHAQELGLQTYNIGSIVVNHHGYNGIDVTDKLYRNSRIKVIEQGMPRDAQGFELDDKYFMFYASPVAVIVKDMAVIGEIVLSGASNCVEGAIGWAAQAVRQHVATTPEKTLEAQIRRLDRAIASQLSNTGAAACQKN